VEQGEKNYVRTWSKGKNFTGSIMRRSKIPERRGKRRKKGRSRNGTRQVSNRVTFF